MPINNKKRLLVIRMSAMGDVAMTVPVIKALLKQHNDIEVDVITRPFFQPLFPSDDRIRFIDIDIKGKHKGFFGLFRLFRSIRKNKYYAIADLHDVLRSQIIRTFFASTFHRVASINKERSKKKAAVRKTNKNLTQLKSSHERYADVFRKLGFPITLDSPCYDSSASTIRRVGIGPFAAHEQKMWPLDRAKALIELILSETTADVVLLGGGPKEVQALDKIAQTNTRIQSIASLSLPAQLTTISALDVVVSMDSANMHIASNYGIPVVSIWGATHTCTGFLGYGQLAKNVVEREDLACRPCSVFGNKPCWRGDMACMDIPARQVFNRIFN